MERLRVVGVCVFRPCEGMCYFGLRFYFGVTVLEGVCDCRVMSEMFA